MKKNVLVTGGAGYVGSHACKHLFEEGYQPIIYDNLSTGHDWAVRWGPLILGDLLEQGVLESAFDDYKPVAVMHFAACALVEESVRDPEKYKRNNEEGSKVLIDVMKQKGCPVLVFSSSCTLYGNTEKAILDETLPVQPINPYGETKLAVEKLLERERQSGGLSSVALRYFNAAGADPDVEIGEDHDPETHLIPRVIGTALGQWPDVQIFGDDYPTPDGSCLRDYIHVSDLATAHVSAMQKLMNGDVAPAINLGAGIGSSVKDVIACVKQVSGKEFDVVTAGRRGGDPASLVADTTLAQNELSWKPQFSSLKTIVETAWQWHISHQGKAKPQEAAR
jgi:UDP-arabinose 4-epimerase